jgi:mannose-6-phosphate isomerase-like protein (cupin superfamily)
MSTINLNDLPFAGSSHELEGYLYGDVPASLLFFDGKPGSGPRLHRHPYTEIFLIQEGQATFTVGDTTIEATAGQILIAPAGTPHKFVNTGTGQFRSIDVHLSDRYKTEWLED